MYEIKPKIRQKIEDKLVIFYDNHCILTMVVSFLIGCMIGMVILIFVKFTFQNIREIKITDENSGNNVNEENKVDLLEKYQSEHSGFIFFNDEELILIPKETEITIIQTEIVYQTEEPVPI